MSDILTNAKRHFTTRRAAGMQSLEVPEWGTDEAPAVIWYRPLNLAERARIDAAMQSGPRMEAFAEALIVRALDEQGKPLFRGIERGELLREVDPDVLIRTINRMNADSPDDEELEKN